MDINKLLFSCISQSYFSYLGGISKLFTATNHVELTRKTVLLAGQLGTGGSADVYHAQDVDSSASPEYALKKVVCGCQEQLRQVEQEIDILSSSLHPAIIRLIDWKVVQERPNASTAYLLMPLYSGGSLWDVVHTCMQEECPLSPVEMLQILQQVVQALAALHANRWIHRDVKPQNILVEKLPAPSLTSPSATASIQQTYSCVVTDFGSCCTLDALKIDSMSEAMRVTAEAENACSPLYRAPELYDVPHKGQLDGRIDIWAVGCLLYFMMMAVNPFEKQCKQGANLVLAVHRARVDWSNPPHKVNPALQELVHACLRPDFRDRPTSAELTDRIAQVLCELRGTPRSPQYRPQPLDTLG